MKGMSMKTSYMDAIGSIRMGEWEKPAPAPHEALVRIEYCGICGSDVHYFQHGRIADYVVEGDFVLGHEVAGVVEAVGSQVTHLQPGDKVALEPGYTCGKCEFCKTGRYNLCPDVIFFATPPVQGALKEYVVHPADMCFKLPQNVSTLEGALVEPLAVGLHAAKLSGVGLGDSAIILGAGCIGLVTLLAVKASGAANVTVVDLYDSRLEYAKKMGADHVINASTQNVEEVIAGIYGGAGADTVFECAGSQHTIRQTPFLVKRGGVITLVGMAAEAEFPINMGELMFKEVTIKTIFRYRNLYPAAIAAIASGAIDVKQIVTHEFPFEDTQAAFETVVRDAKNVVKGVIKL